jgi:PAS domain S-box-containing protein
MAKVAVDEAADAVVWIAADGRLINVNAAASRALAYSRAELLSMSVLDIVPHLTQEQWLAHWQKLRESGSATFESIHRRKDGSVFPVEVSVSHQEFEGQEYHCAFARDISRLKLVAERARESERHFRLQGAALESAANAIVITGRDGNIVWTNPAFTEMTGYTSEEILGANPRVLKSGRHEESFYAGMWETILSGRVWGGEIVNRRKDGSLYTEEMTITPVLDDGGGISNFIAIKRDISERKNLEAQLRQAQKMEAVGQLAGGIAHDFNNLLTGIIGYTQLLMSRASENQGVGDDLLKIRELAERAASLTRQLLAFSRKQSLRPVSLDLNGLLETATGMLERLLGEDIELVFTPAPDLWFTRVDPVQIEQVLMNLAVNARDAMPSGGTLTLDLANADLLTEQAAGQAGVEPGFYVTLTVRDSGHGMDTDTLARIFEPFFTTKEVGKGTGLGLPTVYGIVAQHGGNIVVFSEPGEGATFRIYLPRADGGNAAASAVRGEEFATRGSETILVVEDERRVLDVVRRVLEEGGYEVVTSTLPEEAEELFAEIAGDVSLLITDLVMPGLGGRLLYAKLKQLNPDLKVLYMSGYPERSELGGGRPSPGDPYLQKPFGPEELTRAVREALDA